MLLDSNILIYAANQSAPEIESLATSADSAVASVTQIEVYGFTGLKPEEKAALDILFRRQESKMGLADAIIAATALVHHLPLVTRNEEDFKHVAGLRVVNPFAPAP
jgi:toxin FitB